MRTLAALLVPALLATAIAPLHAQGPVAAISRAQAHFNAGEYAEAAGLLAPLFDDETLPTAERAEALRLFGLCLYFLGRRDEADAALFAYLQLEPDARLDPALVPAEGIAFFEGVRSRHAAELAAQRPRPPRRGHVLVSFLPPFGQFQNREPGKAWAFGAAETLLLATNVTTYYLLRSQCSTVDLTCDNAATAETLRTVNHVSGALFIGVVVYGVWDGYRGWKRGEVRDPAVPSVSLTPTSDGALLGWGGTF